ncbi:Mitochondrial succinate-fumarate transporter [Tilletia horrida]|uniref:Mitochondrial succinate-fumarate transporter n=1 Tax=Tilletia horrida TaxID=155126 RepID=A0AAN6JQF0_9BASI|nr:Mitochondrial succinate-fumarate transporter [Tilletia horrida]KAK0530461.1 Mitochondrial succinate-fumarate transporter [Tilletia horrida]KAK0541581.1 Mitochondrial succinate-fumarate transporter [Tilletia horrida]KAK0564355.1 Mitochondrial succinate-fumarate transporter [Tilletia horrida]
MASQKKKVAPSTHLIAGGIAGFAEACTCHPLDTIKVRMQLSKRGKVQGQKARGFFATGAHIVRRETPLGLYKGLGAVVAGIVPKMAIRFMSFEYYKNALADKTTGKTSPSGVFLAGLGAGTTEAVVVVNPMEVVKIRLQAQQHSLADPLEVPRYRNAAHALYTIIREEGPMTLYRGVALTALRQATNQAANFTAYQELKALAQRVQNVQELPSYETAAIGLISGALGPFSNAPIDTIKTRIQRASRVEGETAVSRVVKVASEMFAQEGVSAFWKGITPRVARVAPGQAVVFTIYEKVKNFIETSKPGDFTLKDARSED